MIRVDPQSIHEEILRRFPGMERRQSVCRINSNGARVDDWTGIKDGTPLELDASQVVEYHGLRVKVNRWKPKAWEMVG